MKTIKIGMIDFVMGIFGSNSSKSTKKPLFCGFPNDPKLMERWTPKTMIDDKLPAVINKGNNTYYTVATFRQDLKSKYRAKQIYFFAGYVIVLDDIGTKVKRPIQLPLSYRIETSPGNFQGGLILDKPCKDPKLFAALISALADKGFSDPGMKGVARWARLPCGVNTKKKYIINGVAPPVRLVEWHPNRRYSIEQIINAFGLELKTSATQHNDDSKSTNDDNTVLSALKSKGLLKSELEAGKYDITCPWKHLHTDQIDHGTVYFAPCPENKHAGGFKCQHGHCSSRTIVDLRAFLGILGDGSKAKKLLDTALELVDQFHVFRDENGEPFFYMNGSCWPLKSREVKAYILRTTHVSAGKALRQSNLAEVLATLESKAICGDMQLKLHLRIARHKGYLWYDLGNGTAVKVERKGWEIIVPPPLFRRYGHQQEQDVPVKGGDPWKLFDFMNITKSHRLETLVLLISYLVPDIAHPIFHPHGSQGSGKTTICKMIKALIDPSSLGVIFAPKNKQELIRQINRHHVSIFDNMSKLDSEMSDILCMACTGGGVPKRQLYTDDEDCIYNFKRCCGLNGINLLVTKPDLLDRTMLLHLTRIPPEKRKIEAELWRKFNKAKPEILGGMFDVLSKAKNIYPTVDLPKLPRLADFAKWGYAIAEALGKGQGKQFITDYEANVKRQHEEVFQNNSLCLAVTLFMKSRKQWEGTVQAAYDALFALANPSKTDGSFPADPKNLRKKLELIEAILVESENITYRFSDRQNDGFHITFRKNV